MKMKKNIWLLLVVALFISCNSKESKTNNALKKEIISYCEKSAIQKGMSESKKDLVNSYCSCSAEKIVKEFTYAEMLQIKNPTPELKSRLEELVKPCIKNLTNSLDEMHENNKK